MSTQNDHLSDLNPPQKEAAQHTDGPLLIIAGAGAGKTRVITHRILHLIKSGVSPANILAITFTNKAAKEMGERVRKLLSEESSVQFPVSNDQFPTMCTFHALGVRMLRESGKHIDVPKHFSIYDESDALSVIKSALKTLDLDPKQFEPKRIKNTISRSKGDLIDQKAYARDAGNEYFPRIVAQVWEVYEKQLAQEKGLDFDDLLLKTVQLLQGNAEVRATYQKRFQYIHVDEYQDTNIAQYELSKLLTGDKQNICVVGDMDQCLPPTTRVATLDGEKEIQQIKQGDLVYSAAGHGAVCAQSVEKVHKRTFNGELITIHTQKGALLSLTPGHILFADLAETKGIHYTYLMYRRDRGFRIGIVQGVRSIRVGEQENGLRTRINQEHADRIWILRVSKNRAEAQYWEQWFAFFYGIPTAIFHTNGRGMDMGEKEVAHLFAELPTEERAKKLFFDTNLSFDYPHYTPQGTTRTNTDRNRIQARLTLCDDKRKSEKSPWGLSRLSINTTDRTLKEKLKKSGLNPRKGKRDDWRFEIARMSYADIESTAAHIQTLGPTISVKRTAAITTEKRLIFQPAANILPTMRIAYFKNGGLVEDVVADVKKEQYQGPVYDLDVANTHNYIAEHVAVHNSIYSWRGADFRNILNFEHDFPNAKVVLLEENYRSTKTILAAANEIIAKNEMRKEKNLFTNKEDGDRIGLFPAMDETHEADFIAGKTKELIASGTEPKDIAVLYRANFQSRVLEDAFLRNDIPYQVLGVKFFARKEVKDVLSFIRAALNPESAADIKRVINVPPRGIGKVTMAKIFAGEREKMTGTMRQKVDDFYKLLSAIKDTALKETPSQTIHFVIKKSGMHEAYRKGNEEEVERLENMYELAELAKRYNDLSPEEGIEKLLEDAALASDQDSMDTTRQAEPKNAVRLMTVHAAKGLEFSYVFVSGLEQDLFPHGGFADSGAAQERAEEERRLFYVALTRAEKKAILSYASSRMVFGMKQVNMPSEFIIDIPDELVEEERLEEPTILLD